MAEAANAVSPATIAVRVRRIEPQVEYTLNVSPETPLSAFRELLAEHSGVAVAQQRLIFRGQVLADANAATGEANTLRACGVVEDGDTLHLVIRADVPPLAQPAQQPRANVGRVAVGTMGVPGMPLDAAMMGGMPQAMLNQYMAAQMMGVGGPFLGAAPGVAGFAVPVGPRPPAPLDSVETFMTRLSAVLERSTDNLRVDAPPPPGLAGVEHSSVQCDGCGQNPILRRRFKSLSRVDYDLCETCAANGQHTQHGPFACLEFPIPVLVMQSDAPPPPGAGAPAAFPPPPPDSTARLAQLGGALGAAEALLSRSAPLVSRAGAALRQEQALVGPARLQAQGATLQAAAALNAMGALCLELSRMLGGAHFGDRPAAAALWQRGPVAYIHPMGLQPLTHTMPSHAYGMQGGMQGGPGAAFSMMMQPPMMQQQRMAMPMQMPMQGMPPGVAVGGPPPSAAEAALTQQIVGAVLSSFMGVPGQVPGQPMQPGAPGAVPLGQTSVTLNFVAGPDGVPLPDGSTPAPAVLSGAEGQGISQMSPMMSLINGMLPVVQQVVGTPTPAGTAPTHPAAAVAQILAQSPALQQALGSALGPQTIHALHSALGQIVASGNDAAAQQAAVQQGAMPPPPPPPPQAAPSAPAPSPPSSDAAPARAVPAQGRSPFDLTRAVTGAPRSRPGSSPPAADSPLQNGAAARPAPQPAATPPPPAPVVAPQPTPQPAQPEATPAAAEAAPAPQAVQGGVSLPARPTPAPAGLGAGLGGDLPPPRRPRRAPGSAPRTPGSAPRAQPRQAPPPDFDMFAQLLGGGPGGPGGGPPPGLGAMMGAGGPGGGGLGSMMASMASSPAFQQMAGQLMGSLSGEGGDDGAPDLGALMSSMMGALGGGGPRPGGGGGRRRRQVVEEAPWEDELPEADAERWARIIAADEAAMAQQQQPAPLSEAYLFGSSQRLAAAAAAASAGNA